MSRIIMYNQNMNKLIIIFVVYLINNCNNNVMTALMESRYYKKLNNIYNKHFDDNYYKKFKPFPFNVPVNQPCHNCNVKPSVDDHGKCEIKIVTSGTCTVNKHVIQPKVVVQH